MHLLALLLPAVAWAAEHDPPPPPAPAAAVAPAAAAGSAAANDTQLSRYEACFEKMVDAGATDNEFMKKCLGLPQSAAKKSPAEKDSVVSVLKAADLTPCYAKLLAGAKAMPKPTGELGLFFTVAHGAVTAVALDSGLADARLLACFGERLRALKFKKHGDEPANVAARWELRLDKAGKHPSAHLLDALVSVAGGASSIPPAAMAAAFQANAPKTRHCQDELLKRSPDGVGFVAPTALVDASGKVLRVAFRELSLGDEAFTACLTKELKSWKLPKPTGPGPVRLDFAPLNFSPR